MFRLPEESVFQLEGATVDLQRYEMSRHTKAYLHILARALMSWPASLSKNKMHLRSEESWTVIATQKLVMNVTRLLPRTIQPTMHSRPSL